MKSINPADYFYELPAGRIASFPLQERDQSKLLLYNRGVISHHIFSDLPDLLPADALLLFNDTHVIPARLHFRKKSGAEIEIFLLNPFSPFTRIEEIMTCTSEVSWECMIGNKKRWKKSEVLSKEIHYEDLNITLSAELVHKEKNIIRLTWDAGLTWSELIELAGKVPLPPYIHREPVDLDKDRYQTIYSKNSGAVAAPTAGLHFSEEVLNKIYNRGIKTDFLTLHVSAGTFQPMKVNNALDHPMHYEQVVIRKDSVMNLKIHRGPVIAVGTTSVRTIESLFWFGVKIKFRENQPFNLGKMTPYQYSENSLPSSAEALEHVLNYMNENGLNSIQGSTEIFIFPGYKFRICNGLITNYHLPGSTLILLVAAMAGENWRHIYNEALRENYRFLSYGDSSMILP